jgi:hypothetical protein
MICKELRNPELTELFIRQFEPRDALARLSLRSQSFCDCSCDLMVISSNLTEIGNLSPSTLVAILSSPSPRIESEDWLYDCIVSRMEGSSGFLALLEFVHCEYLSRSKIAEFVELISGMELNLTMCENIRWHLIHPQIPPTHFVPSDFDPLNGVIAHLTRECGGNVHDHKVVTVTSSQPISCQPHCAARNVVDLASRSVFCSSSRFAVVSPHQRNNWICYDFRKRTVIPTHYTIRSSFSSDVGKWNLKSWAIETSVDGIKWTEIDHRINNTDLNGMGAMHVFDIQDSRECRFIRLVNIGENHYCDYTLVISAWEIFGVLLG